MKNNNSFDKLIITILIVCLTLSVLNTCNIVRLGRAYRDVDVYGAYKTVFDEHGFDYATAGDKILESFVGVSTVASCKSNICCEEAAALVADKCNRIYGLACKVLYIDGGLNLLDNSLGSKHAAVAKLDCYGRVCEVYDFAYAKSAGGGDVCSGYFESVDDWLLHLSRCEML